MQVQVKKYRLLATQFTSAHTKQSEKNNWRVNITLADFITIHYFSINSSLVYNKIWSAFISKTELSLKLLGEKKNKQHDDSGKINWWKEGLGEGAVTSTFERWGNDASWLANECKFHLQFTFIQSAKLVLASPNISCVLRALAALQVSFSFAVCVCVWDSLSVGEPLLLRDFYIHTNTCRTAYMCVSLCAQQHAYSSIFPC